MNAILAGRKFEASNLTENAFIGGILNSVVTSDEFKKMKKKGQTEMTQKLIVLNELVHVLIRSQNFDQVRDFFYAALEDIETASASWKDDRYWDTKLALFRSLARTTEVHNGGGKTRHESRPERVFVKCSNICRLYNDNRCEENSPHMINNLKVFHVCSYCFVKDPIVIDDHPACNCPKKPAGYHPREHRGSVRGGRGSYSHK